VLSGANSNLRVGIITLGCDKNTVDTERLLGSLTAAGVRIAPVDDADVVIVNTCGFIDRAKEESVETILDAVRLKQSGKLRAVVAIGCLVQRYQPELTTEIPEVDLFLGLSQADQLVPQLRALGLISPAADFVPTMERPLRILSTSIRHSSYLKISEGCDHTCAFCAIPLMRGKHRSTPSAQLVREARELEASGVVELNIISQDTTWYGRDLQRGVEASGTEYFMGRPFDGMAGAHGPVRTARAAVAPIAGTRRGLLADLLADLLEQTSIPWLRLFYMYPSGISRELVELMAREPRIVPYLDMPIQHGSDEMLKRMRRPERQATIRERVRWLRDALPDIALRTTVIVGFPGETEEQFEEMLELLEEIRFDHLGAFGYSLEEGTVAATMSDPVSDSVQRERMERVLDLQRAIKLEQHDSLVGQETMILIDDAKSAEGGAVGRTARQALEIDDVTRVHGRALRAGTFVRARITGGDDAELTAVATDSILTAGVV
jgi:ribosomal protein S12 methylthiotransferase